MIDIKFNYFIRDLRGGEKCSVMSIEQISPASSNEKTSSTPCIQTYACGFRRDGSHGDYSMWQGSIFIDIDSKKFNKEFKFDIFRHMLISCLEANYPQNYHWNQISSSGNSLHIVLYFDCERNETNFKKCCILAKNIILDCGRKCGEQFFEILNYPAVVDDCTSHIGQPLYISAYPIVVSGYLDMLTGECNLDDVELIENEYTEQEISFISDAKYKVKKYLDELPDYEYKSCRYPLCWIIFNYFNFDYDKCKEVWSKIMPLILQHRTDYKEDELWMQFNRDYKMSKGKQYAFKSSLLEWCKLNLGFKYKIKRKFEPQDIDLYKADVEYTLKEGEYLSSIDIKFSDGFNHIYAGCGVGKTVFGIEQGKKKRVCFISPMTSINKNSFGKIDNRWLIIDGNYKEEAIHICGSVENALRSKWNICTTWESFALYEMYKYDFDMFIVDESHTMYLYDYRVKSIQKLKAALKKTHSKVILMSGTPSFEICEFDCYKIKINKEITHVPCDIVFYNDVYKGYIYDDIKEWVQKDADNLAVIFYDKTNYRTEEEFRYFGLDIDIFNKNYKDNTDWILENENLKNQITAFSVYGQAGINIYIDDTKKIRMYILNTNALSIIQYANRIRNKEVIDKVVIPYKINKIDNRIVPVDEKANFEEAYNKVAMINETRKTGNVKDIFSLLAKKQLINLKFGLPTDVLGVFDDEVVLVENIYETWNIITHICQYESQIQLIYNHLVSNQFDVNLIYLDNDKKMPNRTRMRSTQFAGQMIHFDFDNMVKRTKDDSKLYLEMTKSFEKIATGDTKEVIERILNHFWNETKDIELVKNNLFDFINGIIKEKGSIKKIDVSRYDEFLTISKNFHEYVDNAFLIGLMNPDLDTNKATAMYVRYVWSDKIDWKAASDETYGKMVKLKNIVSEYREWFAEHNSFANPLNIDNDDTTKMIYTYICGKHNGKKSNGVVVNGIRYNSEREAAEKLNKSQKWVHQHKES